MQGLKPPEAISYNFADADPAARLGVSPDPMSKVTAAGLAEVLKQPRMKQLDKRFDFAFLPAFELTARCAGRKVFSAWFEGNSPYRSIHEFRRSGQDFDLIQLAIVQERQIIDPLSWRQSLQRRLNGRFGLEIVLNGQSYRTSPFATIETNRSLLRTVELFMEQRKLADQQFAALGGKLFLLSCCQFMIDCKEKVRAFETCRANRIVTEAADPSANVQSLIDGMTGWFLNNQASDGALPYKYWPSSGSYSKADNTIRRFMATVAFNRLAKASGRTDIRGAAARNLEFNLTRFYKEESGLGLIEWNGSVKLGAVAMAALAILESPSRDRWQNELAALQRTIDRLWSPDGAFRTFLRPAHRNDNQNFYPGEALLFWAALLEQQQDPFLLARALKTTAHYRRHFEAKPNPAFVPWHTQAVCRLFRVTRDRTLRDYVFEMNDWLLPHQQWGGDLDPDLWGRFYSPDRPDFGPPHASATGVYLEGLVDALELAIESGEVPKAVVYDVAIRRGIRSLAQLQFKDDIDAFYVTHKHRVLGAIRTETDNNEIRIDNLQHGLMALLRYRDLLRSTIYGAIDNQISTHNATAA
jgi:hypothetical protein